MRAVSLKTALLAAALFAGAAGSVYAASKHTVDQKNLQFSVASISVKRGESVTFSNSDRGSHNITVVGDGMNFNGGLQRPGDTVDVLFTRLGTFNVRCGIHPKMKMDVTVE